MQTLVSACLLSTLLLTACDNYANKTAVEIHGVDDKHQITASTPSLMRNIPVAELSLKITLNQSETDYQKTENSDEQWLVNLQLTPNQVYDIVIQWYSSDYLLLEESGQFSTPANGAMIKPVLDYRSAGLPVFDVDCDGYSNLEEIKNNTDLTIAEGASSSACPEVEPAVKLTETNRAWLSRSHQPLDAIDGTTRLTSYVQSLQVDNGNATGDIAFSAALFSHFYDTPTGESVRNRAWISLRQAPDLPKFLEFAFNPAIANVDVGITDQFCKPLGSNPAGQLCTVPFEWNEDHWYELRLQEISPTTWSAQVRDMQTDAVQPIATLTTPANLSWATSTTEIVDYTEHASGTCISGLAPSSMTYKAPQVNNMVIDSNRIQHSDCVKGGAGWSEGMRTVQGALEYKMTLGRKQ